MEKPMGWVQPQEGEMGTESEALRSAMPMELEKGVCYLVKEKKPELSFRLFEATRSEDPEPLHHPPVPGSRAPRTRPDGRADHLAEPHARRRLPQPNRDRHAREGNPEVHRGQQRRRRGPPRWSGIPDHKQRVPPDPDVRRARERVRDATARDHHLAGEPGHPRRERARPPRTEHEGPRVPGPQDGPGIA